MAPNFHLDDTRALQMKIEEKSHDLFKGQKGHAGLQVTRIHKRKIARDSGFRNAFVANLDVWDVPQVEGMRNQHDDDTQIYTIRQDRSWTTLNISRGLFESFMKRHSIMPPFWKFMFTFGRKIEENEFQFPHFARRKNGDTREYAYILRRVELNGRVRVDDSDPWSIRQTAVYHKLSMPTKTDIKVDRGSDQPKSTFLLVAPSKNVESVVSDCLEDSTIQGGAALSWFNVHRILVADSLRGWVDYMAYLEKRLREQSDRIVLASVGDDKVNLSPLNDFIINFEDRQALKMIEDKVLDLQVILPGLLNAVEEIVKELKSFGNTTSLKEEELEELFAVIDEFDEYGREAKMMIERLKALSDMSRSTARLLSDLLSYEEAVSLKILSFETQLESKSMCHLAEKSTKDAAAVKILTIITLIYLPFTIVANFFSTEFVQNRNGQTIVSTNVWLLAAIAIPLTLVTIGLWWTCVHFTKVKPTFNPDEPGTVILQRQHSFLSMVSSKKRQKKGDLESGLASGVPSPIAASPKSTWSSQAPTVKEG